MKTNLLWCIASVATWMTSTVPAAALDWRGLEVSCKMIRGGYSVFGGDAEYSLMVRFENKSDGHPVTIRMHELYNSTLMIDLRNAETKKEVEALPGRTGDVVPHELKNLDEAVVVGPGSVVNIAIGLDGFPPFPPGKYKGKHTFFKMDIPEFQIGKSGEVIYPSRKDDKNKHGIKNEVQH